MLRIEFEQEEDSRWIAEIAALPGVMTYGATQQDARAKVEVLALRTLADRLEHGETVPELNELFVAASISGDRSGHVALTEFTRGRTMQILGKVSGAAAHK